MLDVVCGSLMSKFFSYLMYFMYTLMEEVSCSSRYWYRASSKVIISSDAFCIIPFARFKKREEGNPGTLMFALRVRPFGITLWYKHLLRNS